MNIAEPLDLRPFRMDDAAALYEAARESIAEISPWMGWCQADYCRADTEGWLAQRGADWESQKEFAMAIVDAAGNLLGACGLNRIDAASQTANLGYWVRTSATGRGVATTAGRKLCRLAFGDFSLHRIEFLVAAGNRASQRVAEKLGASREATLRQRLLVRDQRQDAMLLALLKTDWERA